MEAHAAKVRAHDGNLDLAALHFRRLIRARDLTERLRRTRTRGADTHDEQLVNEATFERMRTGNRCVIMGCEPGVAGWENKEKKGSAAARRSPRGADQAAAREGPWAIWRADGTVQRRPVR